MKIDADEALEVSEAMLREGMLFREHPGRCRKLERILSSGRVLVLTAIVVDSLEEAHSLNESDAE